MRATLPWLVFVLGRLVSADLPSFLRHSGSSRAQTNRTGPSVTLLARNVTLPIDHFNASDSRTYQNRYWLNDKYYQKGGPVIFYDHGEDGLDIDEIKAYSEETKYGCRHFGLQEGTEACKQFQNGKAEAMCTRSATFVGNEEFGEACKSFFDEINGRMAFVPLELARKYHGILIIWEHRFYGESQPFPVQYLAGLGLHTYRYLTNEQALEDAVYFAQNFRPEGYSEEKAVSLRPDNTPWIWVGASWPGSRAAFIRGRDPGTFYASWASSAPLHFFQESSVMFNVMEQSLPIKCAATIRKAVTYFDEFGGNASFINQEVDQLSDVLDLDNPAFDHLDLADWKDFILALFLARPFFDMTFQYNGYERSFASICDAIDSWDARSTTRLPRLDFHDAYIAYRNAVAGFVRSSLRYAAPGAGRSMVDDRSWTWQCCSELGGLQTSNASESSPLISRLLNHTSIWDVQCHQRFPYAPPTANIGSILQYGDWYMTPSNTMFTDGGIDPWRAQSIHATTDTNPDAPNRPSTTKIPQCNKPPEGNEVFGLVYPGVPHAQDFSFSRPSIIEAAKNETLSPGRQGFDLFSRALDEWLPCYWNARGGKP